MSEQYPGGFISKTSPTVDGSTARGLWTLSQAAGYAKQGLWPTVPAAPTIGTATGGNASASVAFTAPSNIGSSAITSYTVTSSPGGFTGTGASSPVTVSGLTNGTAYTFTVTATNGAGTGPASSASNSVTPAIPSPTLVSQQTATHANDTSITINAPSTISSGNLLVAFIVHRDTDTGQVFTSAPSGWTRGTTTGWNTGSLLVYYKVATGSEPASYTWSGATVSRQGSGVILNYAYASWDTTSVPKVYQSFVASPPMTLTPSPSSLTVAANNSVIFFAIGVEDQGVSAVTLPSGYTTLISQLGGSTQSGTLWLAYKTGVSAGSSGSPTGTAATSGQAYVLMTVIKPT